jgi:hypothetical protein
MNPRRYLRNLSRHPGLGYATLLTTLGGVAGRGSPRGVMLMSIFWIPVLITSWHNYDKDDPQ